MRIPTWLIRLGGLAAASAVAACGDDTTLPSPIYENVIDTTTLYALTGTALGLASGFDGIAGITARTDLNAPFDFAVDLPADDVVELMPSGAIGLAVDPGIILMPVSFEGIETAPLEGYVQDSILTGGEGTVFVLRSRASSQLCTIGSLPRYSKFRVLDIDPQTRAVTLEFLIDLNCGYRGLEPGTPVD